MAKCSFCNAAEVTCDTCGRTLVERGVSGIVPAASLAPTPDPAKFLRGDSTWQSAGGAGDAASSVTDGTTFGLSSDVGVAAVYAREDHSHGTPANPFDILTATGDVIYASATGTPAVLAGGTTGDLLMCGGADGIPSYLAQSTFAAAANGVTNGFCGRAFDARNGRFVD
jgi:hypothetical protein